MPELFSLALDFQMFSNSSVVAVESRRSNIWHKIRWILHDRTDMADDDPRNALGIRKLMEALIDLQ
jgi:hypothetical protein